MPLRVRAKSDPEWGLHGSDLFWHIPWILDQLGSGGFGRLNVSSMEAQSQNPKDSKNLPPMPWFQTKKDNPGVLCPYLQGSVPSPISRGAPHGLETYKCLIRLGCGELGARSMPLLVRAVFAYGRAVCLAGWAHSIRSVPLGSAISLQ